MKKHTIALIVLALMVIMPRPAEAQVSRAVLERYVGEYVYPDGANFKVELDGDTLVQVLPGRRLGYTPISETMFMLGPVFTAEFVSDEAGWATQILSDGAGVEYRLRRKGAPPVKPAPPVAALNVPRSILERYVGTYEYIPGQMSRTDLRVVIRLKGDSLVRDMGQDAVLTPLSETKFRVGNTSLTVEFVIDEAGVTQILGTGFQQMLARRTSKR
jgi:hypothetical protein